LDMYWNMLIMHVPINVKSPNNISKWQMGFNSAFKGLRYIKHSVCQWVCDMWSVTSVSEQSALGSYVHCGKYLDIRLKE